jgi:hypothetical protein
LSFPHHSPSRSAAVLIALFLIATVASPAPAQTQPAPSGTQPQPAQDVQVFKDWFLRCGNTALSVERCVLFQDLVNQNNQQPLMQIAVGLWGPEALRGIGVRIEDDVVVTPDGCENLTGSIPKRPDEVAAQVLEGQPSG